MGDGDAARSRLSSQVRDGGDGDQLILCRGESVEPCSGEDIISASPRFDELEYISGMCKAPSPVAYRPSTKGRISSYSGNGFDHQIAASLCAYQPNVSLDCEESIQ